ncbi:MAG: hypothetical protein LKJ25_11750 [Clostridia bacterium]|nr:hypothetical protein [Clostridia bacterium]MCI2001010.1 hypothetical protein [Clostridia bacterium]MCI2015609.1 hypothetical protein [Clostridia bacterium]
MSIQSANIKLVKKCAFCKHWDDKSNLIISEKKKNYWEFESEEKRMCLLKNYKTSAGAFCEKYVCKLR